MDGAIEKIRKNAGTYMMVLGALLIVASFTDYALGFEIAEGMNLVVGGFGVLILIVGYIGWIKVQEIELEYKELDVELRKERLRAGGDPREDQTIIQRRARTDD